ncbi:MAG: polyphosphate kinase [Bacteroidia bacterium]|nr:polyphosphate kinase [Bacteroidia bacterium]
MPKSLEKIETKAPKDLNKAETKAETTKLAQELGELQAVLYAMQKHSLLIVLQGLDASGKDGAVKEVFAGINPMGCLVTPFKKPTEEELSHDFLWRVHKHTPARGMIQIFNRSHYEDVLITRVHGWIDNETTKKRFQYINSFEELLQERDTHILKFYLHISHEEQAQRFEERLVNPEKRWKYRPEDLLESKHWDKYRECYEEIFEKCSPEIPWHIVPSDQNWYKEYYIAKTIVEKLRSLKLEYPVM